MALSLCASTVANTGELACDFSKGVLKKLFIFNGTIGSADYVDATTLLAKLVANSKLSKDDANKIFPINEAQDVADASEANKEGSLGLGFKAVLLEGKPAYTVKMFAGADLLKRLRKFNNQTVRILEYDSNNAVWGTKSGSNFLGYQAKLFFTGGKLATGQNVEEGVVTFTISILSTSEYIDNAYGEKLNGNVEDIKALNDVTMTKLSNSTNVHKIKLTIPTSKLSGAYDIWDDFGTAIAALTFTAKTGANFVTPLTITSVAADATLKALTVTFDATTYNALSASAPIKLIGPIPAALDAADVTNVELISVVIPKS